MLAGLLQLQCFIRRYWIAPSFVVLLYELLMVASTLVVPSVTTGVLSCVPFGSCPIGRVFVEAADTFIPAPKALSQLLFGLMLRTVSRGPVQFGCSAMCCPGGVYI